MDDGWKRLRPGGSCFAQRSNSKSVGARELFPYEDTSSPGGSYAPPDLAPKDPSHGFASAGRWR